MINPIIYGDIIVADSNPSAVIRDMDVDIYGYVCFNKINKKHKEYPRIHRDGVLYALIGIEPDGSRYYYYYKNNYEQCNPHNVER